MSATYWRPYHDGWMMVAKLDGSGVTSGGIVAQQTDRMTFDLANVGETTGLRVPMLGVVLSQKATVCEPGDVIVFDEGTMEWMTDASGEQFGMVHEDAVVDVLDGYGVAQA